MCDCVRLLTDPTVLPLVLVALIGFAAHKDYYALVANTESLDVVLHILHHYDLPFKRLAGQAPSCPQLLCFGTCASLRAALAGRPATPVRPAAGVHSRLGEHCLPSVGKPSYASSLLPFSSMPSVASVERRTLSALCMKTY